MSLLRTELVQRFVFFLIIALVVFGAPLLTFNLISDWASRLVVSALATLALIFGFRLATFTSVTANKVRLAVLATSAGLCFADLQFPSLFQKIVVHISNAVFETMYPAFMIDDHAQTTSTIMTVATLAAIVAVSYFVLRSLRSSDPMGEPAQAITDVLPAVTNLEHVQTLKHALRHRLDIIDQATRGHKIFPYLLRDVVIDRPNQV